VQLQPGESRNRRPESKDEQKDQPSDKTTKRLLKTERGVDLTDPTLYESVELGGDSSTATVAGMATGYDLPTYQRFVGSLRKSGYKGNIILGVAPDVSEEVLRYFRYRNVTPKIMKWVNCTYASGGNEETRTCAHPYQDIKIRWSRFPLIRDWLLDCKECTGPVLVMDVRDSFFQLDPFGPGSPTITGLQVYEEDKSQTTGHWLTKGPLQQCLGVNYEDTMLCSGTTTGTRAAMIKYLHIMYEEMKYWIEHEECRFSTLLRSFLPCFLDASYFARRFLRILLLLTCRYPLDSLILQTLTETTSPFTITCSIRVNSHLRRPLLTDGVESSTLWALKARRYSTSTRKR
jgi:hypothetical protein